MREKETDGKEYEEFERTYLERLRLAATVILDAAPELSLITDPLEGELVIFRERVEFALLLPEFSVDLLPWRKVLNGEPPHGGPQGGHGANT